MVLAGNPNCGKSALFNRLTGLYVNVSNFPGTTVDISRGAWNGAELIDTPGVYGLGSYSDEERIARDTILGADVVINVVNATTLERDLFLTVQLVEAGLPLVIATNMMDEAERLGLSLDIAALSRAMGVPVIPIVAVTGRGLDILAVAVDSPGRGSPGTATAMAVREVKSRVRAAARQPSLAEMLLVAEGDEEISARYGLDPGANREEIYFARRRRVDRLVGDLVVGGTRQGVAVWLGEWTARPLVGVPVLISVLYAMYWLVGVFVAQTVVGFLEGRVMRGAYEPAVRGVAQRFLPASSGLFRILVGEFGVLTMTATYTLGLLLPLVAGFYLSLAIMEDSGYLPRVAVLADKALNRLGLNGRAVIPMILGFGCVTMATLTTRVLGSERERTIAVALLGIAIPCSGQLGVIAALLMPLGPSAILLYGLIIFLVYGFLGVALNQLLPGESTDLLLDLPPLRIPRPGNVLKKTAARVSSFLLEALPIFALGALGVAVLQETGVLVFIEKALSPVTVGWLQLPAQAGRAFVMGLIRRDFGAAGLYDLAMTSQQKLVSVVTITLFVPCIASVLVMLKERGIRIGVAIFAGALFVATLTGGLVSRLLTVLWPILAA